MAILLFSLRHVPDDEAEDVRALLSSHGIDFYETPSSAFGISAGAIWLRDEAQLQVARQLIDGYQAQRYATQRQLHEEFSRQGQRRTVWHIRRRTVPCAGIPNSTRRIQRASDRLDSAIPYELG